SIASGGPAVRMELEPAPAGTESRVGIYDASRRLAVQGATLTQSAQGYVLSTVAQDAPVCRAGPLRIQGDAVTSPLNDKETKVRVNFSKPASPLPGPVL